MAELSAWLFLTRSPCQTDCLHNRSHLEETRGDHELQIKGMLTTEYNLPCSSYEEIQALWLALFDSDPTDRVCANGAY